MGKHTLSVMSSHAPCGIALNGWGENKKNILWEYSRTEKKLREITRHVRGGASRGSAFNVVVVVGVKYIRRYCVLRVGMRMDHRA